MISTEDSDVPVKSRTVKKTLFLYDNLCPSVKLDSLSCSITSASLFTNKYEKQKAPYCRNISTFPKFKKKIVARSKIETPNMTVHFPGLV